jgi:molybdopterin molybdotransferase
MIGVLATGSELREPGSTLNPGQIYESNRIGVASLISAAGGIARTYPIVADTPDAVREALEVAFAETDAVVTSGGVSVGEMDLIKSTLEQVGGKVQFWRVAMKPGRPFVFGECRGKILFGLPGNPASALVTFKLLVQPALLRWQGVEDVAPRTYPGVLGDSLINSGVRRHFVRVKVDQDGNVFPTGLQASHALSSLSTANGLVDVPPNTTLEAGARIKVIRLD